jgi:1-deoxy-D-xylulose-5-phosphate reductoisomerase
VRSVTVLGASGSIGKNAIAVIRLHRDKFHLKNIAVKSDWRYAVELHREFGVTGAAFNDPAAAQAFREHVGAGCEVFAGADAAARLAVDRVDVVLAAISGTSGFPSVVAAIRSGNRVAVANKEAVVCGGRQLLDLAENLGVDVIPVDSEHSAIFQSLLAGKPEEVASILLTASGGPFRTWSIEEMRMATPRQALAHPNWPMGAKNSLDSATLANKGLELIEAAYLFDHPESDIEVVVNPSSILHSAVQFRDGSMIAQLGIADMRVAIGYGLSWPDRLETGVGPLSLSALGALQFEPVDLERFPCLGLARASLRAGPDGPMLFNVANEVAGAAFLDGKIGFMDIAPIIEDCLEKGRGRFVAGLDDMEAASSQALAFCRSRLFAVAA